MSFKFVVNFHICSRLDLGPFRTCVAFETQFPYKCKNHMPQEHPTAEINLNLIVQSRGNLSRDQEACNYLAASYFLCSRTRQRSKFTSAGVVPYKHLRQSLIRYTFITLTSFPFLSADFGNGVCEGATSPGFNKAVYRAIFDDSSPVSFFSEFVSWLSLLLQWLRKGKPSHITHNASSARRHLNLLPFHWWKALLKFLWLAIHMPDCNRFHHLSMMPRWFICRCRRCRACECAEQSG